MSLSKTKGGLGFRDLRCFNKALLAKQGWRLLKNPDSLAGQILKAKYFPRGGFLEAELGRRPSFAWRSIFGSKDLKRDGLIWRIGDGRNVHIWRDKWIPTPSTFAIQSPRKVLSEDAKVCALFNNDSKWWDENLLNLIFGTEEANVISRIPLSKYGHKDVMIWRGSSTGDFTVRSAYHIEKDRQMFSQGESSNISVFNLLWKRLWSLQVPNSTKMFIWRACHNILPTKDNLLRKGIDLDPTCVFCKTVPKTVHHVLWECPSATDVWGVCGRKIQKCSNAVNSFKEVVEMFFVLCSPEEVDFNVEIARRIWFRRNSVVHGGDFLHPNDVLSSATMAIGDYKGALEADIFLREPEGTSLSSRILNWCPPPIGYFKANWDAAINSKKGILGFGCVVRDVHGFVVAALSHSVIVMGNPEVAEALAALHTIEFCRNHGFNSIILEGDSLIVVNAINRVGLNWSFLENIILDIQTLLKEFLYWKVCYTPRGTNIAAHSLVKEGVIQGGNRIWLGCIPNCIKTIVLSECSSLVF